MAHDTVALETWIRLVSGVFDDLRWRSSQSSGPGSYAWRVAVTLSLAAILGLWLVSAATPPAWQPPPPPRFLNGPVLMDLPPPPPPPPHRACRRGSTRIPA